MGLDKELLWKATLVAFVATDDIVEKMMTVQVGLATAETADTVSVSVWHHVEAFRFLADIVKDTQLDLHRV